MNAREVAKGLCPLEQERLIGWTGPAGAAYNAISEGLCEMGLLDRNWQIAPLGLAVRRVLQEMNDHDR